LELFKWRGNSRGRTAAKYGLRPALDVEPHLKCSPLIESANHERAF
jgi:hypothetical protein